MSAITISVLVYFFAGLAFATGVTDKGIAAELDMPPPIARFITAVLWPIALVWHWFSPLGGAK